MFIPRYDVSLWDVIISINLDTKYETSLYDLRSS